MIYFTSDLHLGHENILKFGGRPFDTLADMHDKIINNINERVGIDDELYIIGDFAYKCDLNSAYRFRDRIKCRNVHLILGNHDYSYDERDTFTSVTTLSEIKTEYGLVVMCHYPLLEWHCSHRGAIHLHGHIHSTGDYNKKNLRKFYNSRFKEGHHTSKNKNLRLRVYDVGVDANDFYPISLDEIAELMKIPKIVKKAD